MDSLKCKFLGLVFFQTFARRLDIERCSPKGICPCFFHVNVHLHQTPKCGKSHQSSGKQITIVALHPAVIEKNANSGANFHIHVLNMEHL